METSLASSGSSIASGIAIHDGNIDARLSRTLDAPTASHRGPMPKGALRERLRRPLLILFPAILAVFGAAYYLADEPYVYTDDAFIRAAKESVNARVAGQVVDIAVADNQRVKQGQLLAKIRNNKYKNDYDGAKAALDSAQCR